MAEYTRFDSANMSWTTTPTLIKNVRFATKASSVFTDAVVENGTLVVLDSLVPGQHDLYYATAPTATSTVNDIYIIDNAEVISDESRQYQINEFVQKAGVNSFAGKPLNGDVCFITAKGFATAPDDTTIKTKFIDISTSGKYAISNTATAGTTLGVVDDIIMQGKDKMYVLRFTYTCA